MNFDLVDEIGNEFHKPSKENSDLFSLRRTPRWRGEAAVGFRIPNWRFIFSGFCFSPLPTTWLWGVTVAIRSFLYTIRLDHVAAILAIHKLRVCVNSIRHFAVVETWRIGGARLNYYFYTLASQGAMHLVARSCRYFGIRTLCVATLYARSLIRTFMSLFPSTSTSAAT